MTSIQKKKREYQTYKANMERRGCLPLSESQFKVWILELIKNAKERGAEWKKQ